MESLFDQGYREYFQGTPYNHRSAAEWMQGWVAAERHSKCGWYDERGKHVFG